MSETASLPTSSAQSTSTTPFTSTNGKDSSSSSPPHTTSKSIPGSDDNNSKERESIAAQLQKFYEESTGKFLSTNAVNAHVMQTSGKELLDKIATAKNKLQDWKFSVAIYCRFEKEINAAFALHGPACLQLIFPQTQALMEWISFGVCEEALRTPKIQPFDVSENKEKRLVDLAYPDSIRACQKGAFGIMVASMTGDDLYTHSCTTFSCPLRFNEKERADVIQSAPHLFAT